MSFLIFHIDASQVTAYKMLCFVVCRSYCIIPWYLTLLTYHIAVVISFEFIADDAFNNVIVFFCVVFLSLTGCIDLGQVTI